MATTLANPQDVDSGLTTDVTNSSSPSNLPSAGSQQGMVQSSTPANAGLSGVLTQAAVRQAMPGIIVFLTIAVFLLAYSWISEPPYKAVFPGMSAADRQLAYTEVTSSDFTAKNDSSTGELKVPASQ